jgi:hypothetical protein
MLKKIREALGAGKVSCLSKTYERLAQTKNFYTGMTRIRFGKRNEKFIVTAEDDSISYESGNMESIVHCADGCGMQALLVHKNGKIRAGKKYSMTTVPALKEGYMLLESNFPC